VYFRSGPDFIIHLHKIKLPDLVASVFRGPDQYWHACRPHTWLFPNAAGLPAQGGIHSLRHAFATHLLESGVDIHTIHRLLGHGHVGTTMRYFHLARSRLTGTPSPLELLDPPPH